MTITRLRQAGAEFDAGNINTPIAGLEWDYINNPSSSVLITNSNPKSGIYCYRFSTNSSANFLEWSPLSTLQLRTAAHFFATAAAGPASLIYLAQILDASNNILVGIGFLNNDLKLYVGGVLWATVANVYKQNVYQHIGIGLKIDASAGWANVYIDGVLVASFAGNTGTATITKVHWLGIVAYTNLDDLYLDDTTGEAAPAIVPDRRFVGIYPNANGNYSEDTGSDGNSTDNYLLVDDHSPHDGDTTHVEATALDQRDTYNLTTTTIPTGWSTAAVIPMAVVKKTDAGADTQVAMMLRENGVDWEGAAQTLSTGYISKWDRCTLRPDGSAWTQAAIDALEAGFRGKGTF